MPADPGGVTRAVLTDPCPPVPLSSFGQPQPKFLRSFTLGESAEHREKGRFFLAEAIYTPLAAAVSQKLGAKILAATRLDAPRRLLGRRQ